MIEVTVGRIGRPHGVRGEVTVEVRTDEPDRRFVVGARLRDESSGRPLTISAARWHQGRLLVGFDEITDRTAAEEARGVILVTDVPDDETPEDDQEYYDRQLIGLAVRDAHDAIVGEIVAVVHLPAQDALEVRTPDGPRLVPFVTALVPVVDLDARFVRLADVDGLLA